MAWAGDCPRKMAVLVIRMVSKSWGLYSTGRRAFHFLARTEYSRLHLPCFQPREGQGSSLLRQELGLRTTLSIEGSEGSPGLLLPAGCRMTSK